MSNQIRPYEALTSENAALVLVDHQDERRIFRRQGKCGARPR